MMSAPYAAGLLAHARRFVDWWAHELSDAVSVSTPARLPWRVMFVRRETGCDVFVRPADRVQQVGTPETGRDELLQKLGKALGGRKIGPAQIVLRLQPRDVVQKNIDVPAAARDVIASILHNQIERLAPWPADKALFVYEVGSDPARSQSLDVSLAVTGRNVVEGLAAELRELGYAPGVVDWGTDASAEPRVNLLPSQDENRGKIGRRLAAVAGWVCLAALLIGGIGAYGVVQSHRELSALGARLDELRAKTRLDPKSEGYARRQRRQAWLAGQRQAQPVMAVTLEAMSRALPDDAWLNRLEVAQGIVTISGNAANAAALIERLETSRHFADVQLSAPTTRADGETGEAFTITARIVPGRELE